MKNEKKIILDKIEKLIEKRKSQLLKYFPSVTSINDEIVVSFFNESNTSRINHKI